MKKITFKGINYLYQIKNIGVEDGWYNTITVFYSFSPEIKTKRKYIIFGEKVEYNYHKELFRIYLNIESPKFTKKQIKNILRPKLRSIKREKQIERGGIV